MAMKEHVGYADSVIAVINAMPNPVVISRDVALEERAPQNHIPEDCKFNPHQPACM
jgi:rRNA-processing protein FCF1